MITFYCNIENEPLNKWYKQVLNCFINNITIFAENNVSSTFVSGKFKKNGYYYSFINIPPRSEFSIQLDFSDDTEIILVYSYDNDCVNEFNGLRVIFDYDDLPNIFFEKGTRLTNHDILNKIITDMHDLLKENNCIYDSTVPNKTAELKEFSS